MLADRDRLRRRAARPRLVSLHRALGRLRSTIAVMNSGAHPDDEHNAMLAVLRHQMGMRIIIACSTRGEGGQNALGPERGGALGAMRSRELEEAARIIDADIAWIGHGPDDPVHDFGFSKSGEDTLARWGEARVVERLVRAYRRFRPDIVIPTFLDVPGQHGHHRAMTLAAEKALALAADPAYLPDLAPWRIAKFYLPAWSGGGDTYDDEVPPPAPTTWIRAHDADAATGMGYARLGEVSRAFHASQNMGHWRYPAQREWPLHRVGATENDLLDGLPTRLADLGPSPHLAGADAAIDKAIRSFPDDRAIIEALVEAKHAIAAALETFDAPARAGHGHRLTRKLAEIDLALAEAANIDIAAALSSVRIVPGGNVDLILDIARGRADSLAITPMVDSAFLPIPTMTAYADRLVLPLTARPDAPIANAFYSEWQSLGGNGAVSLRIEASIAGETLLFPLDLEENPEITPAYDLAIAPEALILPLPATSMHAIALKSDIDTARVDIASIPGIEIGRADGRLTLTASAGLTAGRRSLPVLVDGHPAHAVTDIAYFHIGRTRFIRPLTLDIVALDIALPDARIGYIGGGADRVGFWLERMGADITEIDTETLAGDLERFDTIVIGIFAFGLRPDLAAATSRLHRWVQNGGHLVTLYHRPGDGWDPRHTPPLPLTIGSPSLRWRVTDPAAPVDILVPDHPLLAGPNRIKAADFEDWDKERGLYFASAWDPAYIPLLSMSDAGEKPLTGALLSAVIGQGRHTHTSLVLHHQIEKHVPGALRLLANLLQPA